MAADGHNRRARLNIAAGTILLYFAGMMQVARPRGCGPARMPFQETRTRLPLSRRSVDRRPRVPGGFGPGQEER
jgi:hypothetical protein